MKTPANLWQYYRDEPSLNDDVAPSDFGDNIVFCLQLEKKNADGIKDVEKMVPLKYLSNFWRTLEMALTANCIISSNTTTNQINQQYLQ